MYLRTHIDLFDQMCVSCFPLYCVYLGRHEVTFQLTESGKHGNPFKPGLLFWFIFGYIVIFII